METHNPNDLLQNLRQREVAGSFKQFCPRGSKKMSLSLFDKKSLVFDEKKLE